MARRTTDKKAAARDRRKSKAARSRSEDTADLEAVDLGTAEEARATGLAERRQAPAPEVEAVEYGDVGILGKSWIDLKRTLKEASQWQRLRHTPYGLTPILIFAFVGIVGGFNG